MSGRGASALGVRDVLHTRWRRGCLAPSREKKARKEVACEKHHIQDSQRGSFLISSLPLVMQGGAGPAPAATSGAKVGTRCDYLGPRWQLRIPGTGSDPVSGSQQAGAKDAGALSSHVLRGHHAQGLSRGSFPRETLAPRMLSHISCRPLGDCFLAQAPKVLQKKESKSKT